MRSSGRPHIVLGREWTRALALLVAFALLVASCAQTPRTEAPPAAPTATPADQTRQLSILYTGYGEGLVDPAQPAACGWEKSQELPVGGLARRATYLRQIAGERSGYLLADTGGTLAGDADAASQRTDELIVRALAAMRYDVLNAGASELTAAAPALRRLAEPSAPALVSSNGQMASADQPATPKPYVVREVGGIRVGIVGVTSPSASSAASSNLRPAVEALRSVLPEVRRQVDVIVALADLDSAEVKDLAAAGLDLQVILGARVTQSQDVSRVGQTVVVAVGGDGRYVGKLTLQIDQRGQVASAKNEITILGQSVADDPDMVALRASYQ